MKYTKLGHSELEVSRVGLGCMGLSDFYAPSLSQDQAEKLMQSAIEVGVNFLDTADMYGPFTNERLVGSLVRNVRDRIVLATKFGVQRGEDGAFLGISGRPEYVKKACEASLRRLGVDVIDLYYQHRVDREVPIEETVGAMAELVREGKVRCLGLSEASAETLRRASAVYPIAALQTEYSLWTRDPEREVLAACEQLGVTLVAYSPLGRGFLTGKIAGPEALAENDWRSNMPRFQPQNLERNRALLEPLERNAAELGCSVAQLALSWVLGRSEQVVAIAGTTRAERLQENAKAVELSVPRSVFEELDQVFRPERVSGARYPEASMPSVEV